MMCSRAGYLRFLDNYTVTAINNSVWTGAGIIVDKLSTVNWQLNGLKEIIFIRSAKVRSSLRVLESTRGLKVGAGTVVLNQQSNEEGSTQAFSSVNIAGAHRLLFSVMKDKLTQIVSHGDIGAVNLTSMVQVRLSTS